jgi:2'-5' RNA ligase
MTAPRDGRDLDEPARGSTRRLFVADAVTTIGEVVANVRAMPLPEGARDARWVRLDGLHLTLRFLGPTGPELEKPTLAAIEAVGDAAGGPIAVEPAGSGAFPSGGRPRTLWIGLARGTESLTELAAATEVALVGAGWQPDPRPFRPHLTLARTDASSAGQLMADRLAAAMSGRRIACTIDRVGVFESVTGGGPARYVPLLLRNLG